MNRIRCHIASCRHLATRRFGKKRKGGAEGMMPPAKHWLGGLALALLLTAPLVRGQGAAILPAEPADVHLAATALLVDLEALRWVEEDGASTVAAEGDASPRLLRGVAARHVFWQAQGLYRRTKQLVDARAAGDDLPLAPGAWVQAQPRPVPEGREMAPADALQVLQDARAQLRALLALRNIHVAVLDLQRDATKGNADVLAKVAQAHRQLNLLLPQDFSADQLYGPVLMAVDRAGDLLRGRYPSLPNLDRGSRSVDVYRRLVDCLGLLQSRQRDQGLEALELDLDREMQPDEIPAADIHDLAALLAADLAHMALRSGVEQVALPRGEYRKPAQATYADVHRLVGALEQQLRWLAGGAPQDESD